MYTWYIYIYIDKSIHNWYLSICLSTYVIYLSDLSVWSTYLSIYLCIYLSIHLSIDLSIYLCIYLSIYLSIYLPIYLSISFSIYVFLYLFISLSNNYLFIYIFISLSIYTHVLQKVLIPKGKMSNPQVYVSRCERRHPSKGKVIAMTI